MNDLLSKLLDLDTLRLGAQGVELGFSRPIPAWAWVGIIAACAAVALWSYWRLTGPIAARVALGLLRATLLIALVFLISGPELVERNESVERDWVMVLVDRSESMRVADAPGAASQRTTRDEQAINAIAKTRDMWRALASERVVQWFGFDAGIFDLNAPIEESAGDLDALLGPADGRRTSLGTALDQALARAAARPLAGVVIFTDGRTISEPSRAAIRRLQADRVPVHVVPLGSDAPVEDLALRRVDAPRVAFAADRTPVRIEIERLAASTAPRSVLVRLSDQATGQILSERRVLLEQDSTPVVLSTNPQDAGNRSWRVELVPEGDDLIAGNNASEFSIELVDRPMRVLYIDGYPRWEQRYLRNLLIREKSIVASTLILAPERRYIQEGDIEIDALPDSPERWAEYDAIMLGDVSPDVFSDEQLVQVREHVARRGGGLLWIGGPSSTPVQWFDTPLADLLPFTKGATDGQGSGSPVTLEPTPTARRLGLLQLNDSADDPWPAVLSDPFTGWSALRFAQRIDPEYVKPTGEVLARSIPDETPLVLSMRFGSGRSLYIATDEIWRWRYARGETLPERFWLQMIRLLGRESLSRVGRPAVIELTPRRADVDQPVRVAVEILDQELAEQGLATITTRLTRKPEAGDDEAPASIEVILRPERDNARVYSAVWVPPIPGVWKAETLDPALASAALTSEAIITLPDDEMRRPETDHTLLAALASETNGSVVPVAELGNLPERIPNRKVRRLEERTEPLWDTPLALMILISIATLEWVGRRVIRLI